MNYSLIFVLFEYIQKSDEVINSEVELRIKKQGLIRFGANFICTLLGILFAFINTHFAIILFLIPVLFNFIPGLLNMVEKLFGFEL